MDAGERWREAGAYLLAIFLCLIVLTLIMNLWQADLSVPFDYSGDAMQSAMAVKGVIDNGWYLHNDHLGAPAGQDLYDFPMGDTLDFLIIKLIALFTRDYATVLNLLFLLAFPLTTLTAMLAFRQLGLARGASIVGSLLFTFLPYHFYRGESHLFLSSYFVVPLVALACLWLFSGRLFFIPAEGEKPKLSLSDPRTLAALGICVLASLTMAYYVFFSCFFLLVAGIAAAIMKRDRYPLLASIILIAVVVGFFAATMLPSLLFQYANGANPYAGVRSAFETEVYGLKLDQLLLPISGHRIGALATIMDKYDATAPLVNENADVALGVIGSVGFLLLLGWAFYRLCRGRFNSAFTDIIDGLSIMNLSAVLLATIGGLGALFAVIYPQFRSINRISVFIAFFSLLALLVAIELLSARYVKPGRSKLILAGLLLVVLAIGVLDQTSPRFIPDYGAIKAQYASDDAFIKQVEASVPPGTMVFQLPYIEFPEYGEYFPALYGVRDYDHFRAYLHSTDLRWSFGSIKGRGGDEWQKEVSALPLDDMAATLSRSGFGGVYVDVRGYPENDTAIVADLTRILGTKPIVSPDGRLYFFDMAGYDRLMANNTTAQPGPAFDPATKDKVTSAPLVLEWRSGFSVLEGNMSDNRRWCPDYGELYIVNPSRKDLNVTLDMAFATSGDDARLGMDGDLFSDSLHIGADPTPYNKTVTVPHGRHIVRFTCYGPGRQVPGHDTPMAFEVKGFRLAYD